MQQTLFGPEFHPAPKDYMIGIYPNGEIASEVLAFRQQLAAITGVTVGVDHTPYLLLLQFSMYAQAEEDLVRKLDDYCFKRLRSANVELSGFHCEAESRSVLVESRQGNYLSALTRKVTSVVRPVGNCRFRPLKHPGALVLTTGLNPEKFNAVQEVFSNKVYARICFANNLVLLREVGEGSPPVVVKSFSLL